MSNVVFKSWFDEGTLEKTTEHGQLLEIRITYHAERFKMTDVERLVDFFQRAHHAVTPEHGLIDVSFNAEMIVEG